jgi:ribosomal protein L24E
LIVTKGLRTAAYILTASFLLLSGCSGLPDETGGGPYLGQELPGGEPVIFAEGIVSTGLYTRDLAMTPDGNEIYFCSIVGNYAYTAIFGTRLEDGRWTEPKALDFACDPAWMNIEPFIHPDGSRFFFISNKSGNQDIWVADRTTNGWSDAWNLGEPVNSEAPEYFPSVTRNGTIYFTREEPGTRASRIFRARPTGDGFEEPEQLPDRVNTTSAQFNAFIDPDERFLIVCVFGRKDSRGSTDYYITFRNEDDKWSALINMGALVNTDGGLEYSPYVSPDGKYLFFMSSRKKPAQEVDILPITRERMMEMHNSPGYGNPAVWWMESSFIDSLAVSAKWD